MEKKSLYSVKWRHSLGETKKNCKLLLKEEHKGVHSFNFMTSVSNSESQREFFFSFLQHAVSTIALVPAPMLETDKENV